MIIAPRTRLKISPFILYLSLDPVCCCENWRLGGCWYRTKVSCLSISFGSSILSHLHSLSRVRVQWAPKYYILYNLSSLCSTDCVYTGCSTHIQCVHSKNKFTFPKTQSK